MKKFHTLLTLLCAGAVLHGQTTATAEFKKLRGDLKYAPLLGNRKPALNYRDAPGKVSE